VANKDNTDGTEHPVKAVTADNNHTSKQQQQQLDWNKIGEQVKLFWNMAYPYYEESKAGRWLFAGMIGLTLLNSGVSVAFSYLGKDFWNALSAKNTGSRCPLPCDLNALVCLFKVLFAASACLFSPISHTMLCV
jgi:ABC-type uncharacterized transport system fused permease/ATPase subunit